MDRSRIVAVTSSLGLLALASACGPSAGSRAPEPCGLAAGDSVFLADGPVFPACAVDREARLIDGTAVEDFRPSVTPQTLPAEMCYTAEVRAVVGPDGRVVPGTARLVRSSDPSYGQAVMEGVPSWRYRPAEVGGQPVRQVVQEKRMAAIQVRIAGQGRNPSPPRC